MKASVIGGGSWGSAFARYLGSDRDPDPLWVREEDIYREAPEDPGEQDLPAGYPFPGDRGLLPRPPGGRPLSADVIFIAVPSQFCRSVYSRIAPFLTTDQIVVSLTKGFEKKTAHADEPGHGGGLPAASPAPAGRPLRSELRQGGRRRHPTALVVASRDPDAAREVQHLISSLTVRAYTSTDVTGVEVAGALKNVIAIAAGIADALEFGLNSRAALITRGLVEITNLGLALGRPAGRRSPASPASAT